jgi:hypothetical protein
VADAQARQSKTDHTVRKKGKGGMASTPHFSSEIGQTHNSEDTGVALSEEPRATVVLAESNLDERQRTYPRTACAWQNLPGCSEYLA